MTPSSVKGSRRERQAAETRSEILEAARRLFGERGYAGTSMSQIAAEAGVAVQTIYSSVGSKRELLGGLLDRLDEIADVSGHLERLERVESPDEAIRIGVQITRGFPERGGELLELIESAAPVEPAMAATLADGAARHRQGLAGLVRMIAQRWGLRDGVDPERGAAIFASVTWLGVWRSLHEEHGWSFDEIEDWLVEALARELLDPSPGRQ